MDSLTKRRVTEAELARLVGRGLRAGLAGWRELTDGTYNAAYAVNLDDGRELILKVAPPPGLELLTHEVDLMRTEVDFYRRAAAAGVPVPGVVFADFDRALLDTDYVFLSRIPGHGLAAARTDLTEEQITAVRGEVAALTARLHTVTGTAYGYPLRASRSWQPSWRAAFGAMVEDLVADARRLDFAGRGGGDGTGRALPAPPERIGALLRRHADVLDDVDRPALVHFDLWDGNVFVGRRDGRLRVEGLIDGERAFYGDPVAEFVSLALFRDVAEAPEILDGYAAGGGTPYALTPRVRRRLNLYTTYLYMVMAIEGATRGWYDAARVQFEEWLAERLDAQLMLL